MTPPPPPPEQVLKVDGKPVNNLRELVAAVAASTGQYITLDLEYNQARQGGTTGLRLPPADRSGTMRKPSGRRAVHFARPKGQPVKASRAQSEPLHAAFQAFQGHCSYGDQWPRGQHTVLSRGLHHSLHACIPPPPPLTLRFLPSTTCLSPQLVILDREAAHAATADILTQHCIPHDRSEDLRAEAAAAAAGGDAAAAAEAAKKVEEEEKEEEEEAAAGMDVDVGEEAKSGGHGKPGGGARPAR